MTFVQKLQNYLDAGFPLLAVTTAEEARAELDILAAARRIERRLSYWSVTEGVVGLSDKRREPNAARNPLAALAWAEQAGADNILILRDYQTFLQNPEVMRKLRDVVRLFKSTNQCLIMLGVRVNLPPELEKEVTFMEYALPTRADLAVLMDNLLAGAEASAAANGVTVARPTDSTRERSVEAALGLTHFEAENAFALSLVARQGLDPDLINEEKSATVRKSGILEVVPVSSSLDQVGGMGLLKGWLQKRQRAFSAKARDFGLPPPRGIILIGVPGSGKSLLAKSIAHSWRLPLLRLDVGRLFGSLVGESEGNLRRALALAEAVSPVVLWIDEIEKGFSGVGSSNRSDGGTSARVFGHFLTWMQEKRAPVFVVATANLIEQLPPEFLRKGRFDEIFFVDLPTPAEREEILRIHLGRRKREFGGAELRELARLTEGYTGAELEEGIVAGLFDAFHDGERELRPADVALAVQGTTPLSVIMGEEIKALRTWAKHRARSASGAAIQEDGGPGMRQIRVDRREDA